MSDRRSIRIALLISAIWPIVSLAILASRWMYLHRTERDFWLLLANFIVVLLPFAFSIFFAFVPDMKTKHIALRISVVVVGIAFSVVLWEQQKLAMDASARDQKEAIEKAVSKSNEHTDEKFGKFKGEIESDINKSTSSLNESIGGERVIPIRVGVYSCLNCDKHFRLQTGLAEKGKHYSKRALEKGFVAIRDDKNTFTALPNRLARDFHIGPSKSTCHRWFHERAGLIDFEKQYEPRAIQAFSGALAIDEVYDKEFCLFFATDPLNNRPLSFHLCTAGNTEELRKFLLRLRSIGVMPEVLIVDGSNLYASTPQEVWPNVKIQLCVFHSIRNCQDDILNGVRAYYRSISKAAQWTFDFEEPEWWTQSVQKKARQRQLLRTHRYIFTTRREKLSSEQQGILAELCANHPVLAIFRQFEDDLLSLFGKNQTKEMAFQQLASMLANPHYSTNVHLRSAIARFGKGTATNGAPNANVARAKNPRDNER